MRNTLLNLCLLICTFLLGFDVIGQTTVTIGTGTSSSSTRGPFQRSDTASSTVYSRFIQVYTQDELVNAGIPSGVAITSVNWELASSNVIIGSGDATMKVYIKNSDATEALPGDWVDKIDGSTLVSDNSFNTSNNFPGENGWMPFSFSTPFIYTGGALEIAVDWDCAQVSTPAFSGDGAIKWRWESTAPNNLVVKKTSSSAPSTNISDQRDERANIQIVYDAAATPCSAPVNLFASGIGETSATLNWGTSSDALSYDWLVVPAGAGSEAPAVQDGNTSGTSVSLTGLASLTSYDFYVESICDGAESGYAGPLTFLTLPEGQAFATIGVGTSSSSTRGPFQRSDTASSTVFSRFVHVYTAAELSAAGLVSGTEVVSLNWDLASSNTVIGSGNASLKIYIKNSSANAAAEGDWTNLISGSALVADIDFNVENNFPGEEGWMNFAFTEPFTYNGESIEIAVDWDCSQVTTPAFSGDGSLKWRWDTTAPDFLVVKKTSSSAPSTNIDDLRDERANIQFVYAGTPNSTESIEFIKDINLYPNPTNDLATLRLELTETKDIKVQMLSVTGRLIDQKTYLRGDRLNVPLDLSNYESGIYYIRLVIDGQQTTQKLILTK